MICCLHTICCEDRKMSTLKTLIKKSKMVKRELLASTVRMPIELHSFVDELAEHLSLSRQEMLLKLIEEGVLIAKVELKLDEVEEQVNCNFHILNTNKRHSLDDHERMLKDGIAAAFYGSWKKNINRISENDIIYLYENGKGIVGYGKGTGETLVRDHNGDKDECYYQILNGFKILERPFPASEIKKTLNRNMVFLRTMTGIPDGQKILDKIRPLHA